MSRTYQKWRDQQSNFVAYFLADQAKRLVLNDLEREASFSNLQDKATERALGDMFGIASPCKLQCEAIDAEFEDIKPTRKEKE